MRRNQLGDRGGVLVIDHERRPRPARRRDQLAGLLDRLGPADLGGPGRPAAAAGRVDVEARAGKLDRDRPAGAARRARDESHRPSKRPLGHHANATTVDG